MRRIVRAAALVDEAEAGSVFENEGGAELTWHFLKDSGKTSPLVHPHHRLERFLSTLDAHCALPTGGRPGSSCPLFALAE
jgi:hypothetical protein